MTDSLHFILIRGLLREARHWGGFPRCLLQNFPGACIETPDIPGSGQLHHLTSPASIMEITDVLRQQVIEREKLTLIAISMGGMIAIDWMTRYPDEVGAAVLINTSVRPLSPFYHRLRWTIYPCVLKMIFSSAIKRETDILALTSNRHSQNSIVLECWQQWQQQNPVSIFNAVNQLLAAAKFSIASKPRQPILIITSQADRLVDYHCSLRLARTWTSDYVQHNTAGHDLPLDEPDWLAGIVKRWLKV